MDVNRKDLATGVIFIAVALLYGTMALTRMPVGTATQMGPGFFPTVLAVCLAITGVVVVIRSLTAGGEAPFGKVSWRAVVMLSLATILFAAFADELGMLPATFVTAFVACLASPSIRPLQAAITAVCIAAFCSLVFTVGLGVPLPILGSLFGT